DARGAGVEPVLHKLFDHARRTLHDLARGDAVDDAFGELAYGHLVVLANRDAAATRAYTAATPLSRRPRRVPGQRIFGYIITTLLTTYRIYRIKIRKRYEPERNQCTV